MMKKTTFIALALVAILGMVSNAKAAQVVGNTVAVNPDAQGTPPGAKPRTLVLGTGLVFNERIDTSGNGLVQVLLVDGTSMIVGPGSSITINKFVYDPDKGDGSLALTMSEGTMRFIGGALSKKKGVQVTTPVGTLAIRGAITDLQGDESGFKASLVYGKELSFTPPDGKTSTIYESNYTMVIGPAGTGSVTIRKTEKADTLGIQQALAGKSGQHGGATGSGVPTDTKVEDSNFAEVNSDNEPAQDGSTKVAQTVESQPPQDVGNEVTQNSTSDGIRNDVEEEAFCTTLCINFRIFTAPVPTFNVSFGPIVSDPGSQGLIGGTSDPNADTRASAVQIDADTIRVTRDGQSIDVPFNTTPGLHDIPSFTDFNGNTQTGTLYVGAEAQFFFYALFENGDIDSPTYAFGGTPTPVAALEGGDRLITYTVLPDPRQNIDIPLTLASLVPDTTGASISPFYLMAPDSGKIGNEDNPNGPGHGLQATLLIRGQGADQTSEATLIVGAFFEDNGATDFGTGSRGSVRVDPTQGALVNGGGVGFIKGPERSVFYGPDANNAVLSSTLSQNDALGYSQYRDDYDFQTELLFSTMHVLEKTGEQPQSELTDRSTKSLSGYAAGMLEGGRLYNDDLITSAAYRSTSSNLQLNFDATRDTMGASFTITDVQDSDPQLASYHLSFGFDPVTGGYGRGAYVDDDRYGATGSNNPNGNFVVTDASDVITIENDTPDDNFMYFFGNDLAPQTEFFSAGHQPCVCKFLEWGYWGGKRQYFDADAGVTREEFYHLGTWVAGDISNEADLPSDGSATYSGHAVGDVTRTINGVDNQYVAGGGFDMTWDFGTRMGTATISDFDGITASAPVTDTSIANAANSFAGSFSGTDSIGGNSVTGGLNGSFVTGPDGTDQGVIGSFDFAGPGVTATGIVAAERPVN
jgi:hypothetical protein